MTNRVTIRIPYSELVWGSCYATVDLEEGVTAEQYLAKVQDGTAYVLMDACGEEWTTDGSDSQSFEFDEAEIYNDA
jgi:hypothetical protein